MAEKVSAKFVKNIHFMLNVTLLKLFSFFLVLVLFSHGCVKQIQCLFIVTPLTDIVRECFCCHGDCVLLSWTS